MQLSEVVRNLYDSGLSTGEIARQLGIAEARVKELGSDRYWAPDFLL